MTLGVMETAPRQTLASTTYDELRDSIIAGSIGPDTKLIIRDLCGRFSVGLSPIREALSRLSAEGLVQQTDNRGFSVKPVSVPELLDLTQARCWINEVGLRQSVAHGGEAWEEALVLSLHRLSRTPRHTGAGGSERNRAWDQAHRMFHRSLVDGCGSVWLVDICERLFEASERYRHLARLAGKSRGGLEDEHRLIMEAAIDRRADEAVERLVTHFRRTAAVVQRVVEEAAPLPLPQRRPSGSA